MTSMHLAWIGPEYRQRFYQEGKDVADAWLQTIVDTTLEEPSLVLLRACPIIPQHLRQVHEGETVENNSDGLP